jgi:hypothetical protein
MKSHLKKLVLFFVLAILWTPASASGSSWCAQLAASYYDVNLDNGVEKGAKFFAAMTDSFNTVQMSFWTYYGGCPACSWWVALEIPQSGQIVDVSVNCKQTNPTVLLSYSDGKTYAAEGVCECLWDGQGYVYQCGAPTFWELVNDFGLSGCPSQLGLDPGAADMTKPLTSAKNRPNPFSGSTTLSLETRDSGRVDISIYDVSGRKVRTLLSSELPAGPHSIVWDGCDDNGHRVQSGVYFYEVGAPNGVSTRKMVVLR